MMDVPFAFATLSIVPLMINFPYIYALIVGVLPIMAFWFYSKALLVEEISRLITLFQLIPVFVALLSAIFLNEILGLQKYFGIAIIVIASMLISFKFKYMITFSLIIAIYSILEKFLLRYFEFWSLFFWNVVGGIHWNINST
jgi:drug/metabolite transporter (DMT)-like permease